jgi:hypothetical protein
MKLVINDSNYRDFLAPVVDGQRKGMGLVKRDLDKFPPQVKNVREIKIIPREEWPERIAELKAKKARLSDIRKSALNGKPIPSLDQGSKGFCWTHSVTHGLIINRAKANMPYVPLSAYSVACKIKNFRDEGGWGALALEFIEKNGIMPQTLWPQGSMVRTNDRPENWKVAQDYKVTDSWADLTKSIYDRTITFDQTMSLLLAGTPVVLDLYWWGHSVLGLDPLEVNSRLPLSSIDRWGINIWNSWGDDWSELGEGELHGSKAVPDGAVAPLTIMGA